LLYDDAITWDASYKNMKKQQHREHTLADLFLLNLELFLRLLGFSDFISEQPSPACKRHGGDAQCQAYNPRM
jgi:hypothetical protein